MTNGFKLTDLEITRYDHKHAIQATYIEETDTEVKEHSILVPLNLYGRPITTIETSMYGEQNISVDLGFGELEHAMINTKVIEKKNKEMTLEEIEEKLGYKVVIVSDENAVDKLCGNCKYTCLPITEHPCKVCDDVKTRGRWEPGFGVRKMSLAQIEEELGHPVQIGNKRSCDSCKYGHMFSFRVPCTLCDTHSRWEPR